MVAHRFEKFNVYFKVWMGIHISLKWQKSLKYIVKVVFCWPEIVFGLCRYQAKKLNNMR